MPHAGLTAHMLVHRSAGGRVKPGSAVLVHGAGGAVGALVAQMAARAGATVYGTCSPRSFDGVKAAGGVPIDYNSAWEQVRCDATLFFILSILTSCIRRINQFQEVMKATGGKGVDAVFDPIVLSGYFRKGVACLKRGGTYLAYAFHNSKQPKVPLTLAVAAPYMARGTGGCTHRTCRTRLSRNVFTDIALCSLPAALRGAELRLEPPGRQGRGVLRRQRAGRRRVRGGYGRCGGRPFVGADRLRAHQSVAVRRREGRAAGGGGGRRREAGDPRGHLMRGASVRSVVAYRMFIVSSCMCCHFFAREAV